jgi:HEAT repeat protein
VARRGKLEEVLERLSRVARAPEAPGAKETLREALRDRSPHAVARAARIVGEQELGNLEADLVAGFERFMAEPRKDVGCTAKAAIAEALYRLGADAAELFLRGIRHVQYEAVYGGRTDVATDLRGASALGLVRCGYHDALNELAPLLADPAPSVRVAGVRAVAYRGGDDGTPLLRLKALLGDAEPQVTTECLTGLMRLAPGASQEFVARWLDDPDPVRVESAVLALGESRTPEGYEALRSWCERNEAVPTATRRLVCRGLTLLRRDEAFGFLVERLEHGPIGLAVEIIDELSSLKSDENLRGRVASALERRDDADLSEAFERAFG